jgi:hypothetical protein
MSATYRSIEDFADKDVVFENMLSLTEKLLFKVFGSQMSQLGCQGSFVVDLRFYIDDIVDMSLVIGVIPTRLCKYYDALLKKLLKKPWEISRVAGVISQEEALRHFIFLIIF